MKSKNTNSITKDKGRYNDDFALKFTNNNIIFPDYDFQEVTRYADWSICFNAFLKEEVNTFIVFQPGMVSGVLATSRLLQIRFNTTANDFIITMGQVGDGLNISKNFKYTMKLGENNEPPTLVNFSFVE